MGFLKKAKLYFLWKKKVWGLRYQQLMQSLHNFYIESRFFRFFRFLFHSFGPDQFDVSHIQENFKTLADLPTEAWLDSTRDGKLKILQSKVLYRLKNALLFGAPQNRVEKSVYFTLLTLCLEVHNPFTLSILEPYITRKTSLLYRIAGRLRRINRKPWKDYSAILVNINLFLRNSHVQERVIQGVTKCVSHAKEPDVVKDVKNALKMGLFPVLVIQGLSGTYWMRGTDREIAGLFKPFDEEAFAPNNPGGPVLQGAMGLRKMRPGIRVGECCHREVAAFVVDQFFGFGIVPKTYYASFSHHVFHQATSQRLSIATLAKPMRKKMGSFQEFIAGFICLSDMPKGEWSKLPEVEVQLLILLDVIVGNCDRNMGNILVSVDKIAAIDHGLCFSDINFDLSTTYWEMFEQSKKPLPAAMVELLKNFPFEHLRMKLQRECLIDLPTFERLRERVVFFREGILRGHTPFERARLFSDENMDQLYGLNLTLEAKCREILDQHFNKAPPHESES